MKQTIKTESEYTTLLRMVDVYNDMTNREYDVRKPLLRCRIVINNVLLWDTNKTSVDYINYNVSVTTAINIVARLMTKACNIPNFLYDV